MDQLKVMLEREKSMTESATEKVRDLTAEVESYRKDLGDLRTQLRQQQTASEEFRKDSERDS